MSIRTELPRLEIKVKRNRLRDIIEAIISSSIHSFI